MGGRVLPARHPGFPWAKGRVGWLVLMALLALAAPVAVPVTSADEPASPAASELPLHERIDLAIAAGGPAPQLCSDADFLRRVYLDLVGMVPTAAEARAFLDDPSQGKRERLIDALLADPRFARRMANVFDSMLMERRADKHVKSPEWEQYLYESFVAGKPLNVLCREILSADGADKEHRSPARFYLDREVEPNLLTRDVGRIFFGKDLQCAQCHDHPLIADYYQTDYYGIYAFLQRSFLFEDKTAKVSMLGEKAEGEANYQSVFVPSSKGTMPPMLPGGSPMVEPQIPAAEAYLVKPDKNVRPVPKFSRRVLLAEEATSGKNVAFNRNLANRLWAVMMGRGLVEPVDLHHADNPPTHPALLEDLTQALAEMNFEVKAYLRELALSRTYQRQLEMPTDVATRVEAAQSRLAELEAELAKQNEALKPLLAAWSAAEEAQKAAQAATEPLAAALKEAQAASAAAKPAVEETAKALEVIQAQATAKAEVVQVVTAAAEQTAAAVAKLPEDAELKEAAAKFAARAEQLTTEHKTLAEQVAAKKALANAAMEKLVLAKRQVAKGYADIEKTEAALAGAREAHESALAVVRARQFQVAAVEQSTLSARVVSEQGAKLAAASLAQQKIAQAQSAIAAAKTSLERIMADLPTKQAAQATAEQTATAAQAQLAALRKDTAEKQAQLTEVAAALAKAEEAKAKLPEDATVVAAAEMVQQSHASLSAAIAELEKQQATQTQLVKTTSEASSAAAQQTAALVAQQAAKQAELDSQQKVLGQAQAELASAEQNVELARAELLEHWTRRFVVGTLQPLTSQQMTWSILQVTGLVERQVQAAADELQKKTPLDEAAQNDPARLAARQREIFELAYSRLHANSNEFVNLFAASPGQPQDQFFATVDQALFFGNGMTVSNWIAGGGGGQLLPRLTQQTEPAALAEELYLSVLTRRPSPLEIEEVSKYLAQRGDERSAALQELVWALVTSAEFRFNH